MATNNALLINAQAPCISISVTTSASSSVPLPSVGGTIRLFNEGTAICYVSVGVGSQTATVPGATAAATCTPVAVGDEAFSIPSTPGLQISAITASGTATLRLQVSEGQ